ncbi:MAG: Bax inhibitor-1/YccA family protein [Bdellovibrionaceae bacterium]|nr:Bax inhibitor-1/YccA family protein [Pseudobdellovibrionaceae bacterium]
MRTSNPALSESTFQNFSTAGDQTTMTIQGTVLKSFLLIFLVIASAALSWSKAFPDGWGADVAPVIPVWYLPAIIGAFIVALVIIFKKNTAPLLAPVYAVLEGATLGALSALFEFRYPGIVVQAVLGTCGTFLALLLAYQSGLVKATENFKLGVVAATGGIALVYVINFVMNFFGMSVPYLHDGGPIGIGLSVFIVIVAALNLVLDFDFIEKGAEQNAPKFMEWYAAFGLLVTLIWLYLEILRLLGKSRK